MKQVVPTPAVEFSLFDLANAYLANTSQPAPTTVTVGALVDLLIGQAVADADQGEDEDAGKYALLAALLIDAYKLKVA